MHVSIVTTSITQIFGNYLFLVSADELTSMLLQVWHFRYTTYKQFILI